MLKNSFLFCWWQITTVTLFLLLISSSTTNAFIFVPMAAASRGGPSLSNNLNNNDYNTDNNNAAAATADNILSSTNTISGDIGHLVFQPSILDFNELSIGDADNDVVTVFNKHQNRSVYLGAISGGNVPDFYSSFFEEKVIPPMSNTTFNVVFLPRQQGFIQTQLKIHTSFGVINYTVRGKGVECLFRLNPLIGIKAPQNATLTPEIFMYNPFNSPLQIMEVYSSGGQFHLELPTGQAEAPSTLWTIQPYYTKPIIRVRFTGNPGNHTAYIRIKISSGNDAELENVILVVPIEIEITNHYGIYSKIPIINFGLGGTNDFLPKRVTFKLFNSGRDMINIQSVSIEGDPNIISGISIIDNINDINEHKLITATADWTKIKCERYFKGNIIVTSVINNKDFIYKIPFHGELVSGSIHFNSSQTKFIAKQISTATPADAASSAEAPSATQATKSFQLKNKFKTPLAITKLDLPGDAAKYFKIMDFQSIIIQPNDDVEIFRLTQLIAATKQTTTRTILMHTNVSIYEIPVISYSGLLRRIVPVDRNLVNGIGPDEKSISYGTLPLSTLTDTVLAFVNDNPLPISIHNWKGTMSGVASIVIILRGCGNLTMDNLKFCYSIQPGEWIVFQISVLSNTVGTFVGNFFIKTDYEEISTPVRFTTAIGRLEFKAEMFDHMKCFPAGLCSVNITAHSTFHEMINIDEILINVTGLSYDYPHKIYPTIMPNEETHIGLLSYIPRSVCDAQLSDCYIEFPDNFTPSMISANCRNLKRDLFAKKLELYRAMKSAYLSINYLIKISEHKRYEFNGSANLLWPKFVNTIDNNNNVGGNDINEDDGNGPIEFDTIQTGNKIIKYIIVRNPTSYTMQAYFMLHNVSINGAAMTYPPEIISHCWDCFLTRENVFKIIDTKIRDMNIIYIQPNEQLKIGIEFETEQPGKYSTLLYVRNNYTILEAIWLTAKAVVPQFKFGNRKPGSQTPLLFELSDKHLRDCYNRKKSSSTIDNQQLPPTSTSSSSSSSTTISQFTATAKRTFTARNTGDVTIKISNIRIGGESCEGYGFRILDCEPFELAPNGSKKLEIAFTPDFTLARVTKLLEIETSLNYSVNYTLLAMIPVQALGPCGKAIRRPDWEPIMHRTVSGVLTIAFILVISFAVLEADSVLKCHLRHMSKNKGPTLPTFNLQKAAFFADETIQATVPSAAVSTTISPASKLTGNNNCTSTTTSTVSPIANGKKSDHRKRHDNDLVTNRKSLFVPIKSDVKFREPTPPPSSSSSSSISSSSSSSSSSFSTNGITSSNRKETSSNRKHNKELDNSAADSMQPTKRFEDDSSSTTTENSMTDNNESKSISLSHNNSTQHNNTNAKSKKSMAFPLSDDKQQQQPIKSKTIVKKAKSLPMSNSNVEPSLLSNKSIPISSAVISPPKPVRLPLTTVNTQPQQQQIETKVNHVSPSSNVVNQMTQSERGVGPKKQHGKTPGRERRKNDTTIRSKQMPNKVQTYKGTAFQFTSPITNVMNHTPSATNVTGHSSIWDTNKISFSNVVAQNSYVALQQQQQQQFNQSKSTFSPTIAAPNQLSSISACKCLLLDDNSTASLNKDNLIKSAFEHLTTDDHTTKTKLSSDCNNITATTNDDTGNNTNKTINDLGPIGSKKSPMSTPIWEPLNHSIEKPLPTSSTSTLNGNSNSFFSGSFPYYPSNDLNVKVSSSSTSSKPTSAVELGGASGLLDNVYGNGMIAGGGGNQSHKQRVWDSALLLSVLQQQQHHDDTDLGNLSSIYSNTNSLWGSATLPQSTTPQQQQNQKLWFHPTMVRPPPGLELRNNNLSSSIVGGTVGGGNSNGMDKNTILLQHGGDDGQNQENILPPFDPFSSLSSIWSSDSLMGGNGNGGSSVNGSSKSASTNQTNNSQQQQ